MSRRRLEEVLNALVPFAKSQLEETGDFAPVAAALDRKGEVELHLPRGEGGTTTDDMKDLLRRTLRDGARRGEYVATGLCLHVGVRRGVPEAHEEEAGDAPAVDAIGIHLEAPGESLMAFVPYAHGGGGAITYDEIRFGPAEPEVFAGLDPDPTGTP